MTSHSSLLAGLAWLFSAAVVVPWLAAGESSIGRAGCQTSCGGVDMPFPFGIGDGCWLLPGFKLACKDTGNGVFKPFMVTINETTKAEEAITEVLSISPEQGEAKVLNGISSYCYNATSQKMEYFVWHWNLNSYSFSSTANKFTVVGCRALAYISDTRGSNTARYQTGCVSTCFDGKMSLTPCSGMGCCQTAIPKGLGYFQVWFDEGFSNISGITRGEDLFGQCSFAVLMESSSNFTLSNSTSNNISTPKELMAFNSSRGGMAPVVLDWSIGLDDCKTAATKPGYACLSSNSFCSDAASRPGYICKCNPGFHCNPYLPDGEGGCQDIDECYKKEKYHCFGECTNTVGSFYCNCSRGTQGNASIPDGCQKIPFPREAKNPFPREARITAGILVGVFVALIAFLSTQVYLKKESNRRQGYFEQHGGRMLKRILETDGNNITFKLYERGDLVKATRGFHKDNIVGEGAHGTVYKAILAGAAADALSNTVAVKRCKQIDKSRTDEFVQEMVVLCRVSHPNIVRLLGCCLHFEAPMLVYEFVPNGTLSDLLYGRPRRLVTLPTRLRIAAETAEALAHLHSPPHPTLHGDVKPQNILLGDGWVAKVSDFGCSTINDNKQVVPKGTLVYLDPEFLKDFQIMEKTDVYSFGIVLIELLTGKNPQDREWKNLTTMFENSMGNGTLGDLLDADIVEEGSMAVIYEAVKLVSRCIASPGNARPAMRQVAVELRRFSDQMPESSKAQVDLDGEDHRYSYTAAEEETIGFSNLNALSTELAR